MKCCETTGCAFALQEKKELFILGSTPSSLSIKEKLTARNKVTQDTWDMKRFSFFLLFFFVMTIIHNLQTWCRRKNKKSDIISIKFPTSSSLHSAFHLKPILTLMTQFIYVQVKCENRLYPPIPLPSMAFHFTNPWTSFITSLLSAALPLSV